jgi:hypothetical protein
MIEGATIGVTIFEYLAKNGIIAVFAGGAIWYLITQLKKKDQKISSLETELKDYSKDYRDMDNNSLKVLTLVDDKLKTDILSNEIIKDIHRMVEEILSLQKDRT